MTFTDMVGRAFRLWWRHKRTWVVGVALALCGRGAYSFSANFQQGGAPVGEPGEVERPEELLRQLFPGWLLDNLIPIVVGALLLGLLIWLIGGLLGAWASAAGIHLAAAADGGEPIGLREAFGRGAPYTLRLFGLELLVALPVVGLTLVLLAVGALTLGTAVAQIVTGALDGGGDGAPLAAFGLLGGVLCLIPLFLLVALLGALLGLLAKLGARACVLEGRGALAGLGRAWQLARRSFGYLLLLWIMLIALGGTFSLVAGLPALALLLFAGPALFAAEFGAGAALAIAALAGYLLLVGVLLGGALTGLNEVLWTLSYRWFADRAAAPPQL